jgi:GMP synthase (glutamine-hydrolyzing), C-terminal domain or B subunit/GMP synthase (glutamine-hydrolyzing), N-terminal domain or A subunit
MTEKIIILDFGSQYTQLIGRRLRELNVYCEIHPCTKVPALDEGVKGVILSGSPFSVRDPKAPQVDLSAIKGKLPLLGICFGAQYLAQHYGGEVSASNTREYGRAILEIVDAEVPLFKGLPRSSEVWMSHGDTISQLPTGAKVMASTQDIPYAAYYFPSEPTYALQFHPEVFHTEHGTQILKGFLMHVCGCSASWTPASFVEETVEALRAQLGQDRVVLGLSGGVDSSVAAVLLNKAIGKQLYCIFVDNGLLRKNEYEQVMESYRHLGLNVIGVRAQQEFYTALAGVTDTEQKRKIIGRTFIEIFDREAHKIENVHWLAQGTIYPDVIESSSVNGPSQTIKSHHNVGGLPETMKLKIVEPLRMLFKDEVRRVGISMGMRTEMIARHPFPGPGLAIRILGDITPEKVRVLQEADDIFIQGLRRDGLYDKVWQACTILLPIKSVGVMGDERTYENVVALRAVNSTDGMTADWSQLPYEFLGRISNEIINKVKGVNRVVYDISSKPPATIEWE